MKTCFKCGAAKSETEFYRHPMMADGLLGKCKACTKNDSRNHYANHREAHLAYSRARLATPEGKAVVARSVKHMRVLYPEKYRARYAVTNAVRDGRLAKGPCKDCGATNGVQAHHPDYGRPLDVEWLCFSCHRGERHKHLLTHRSAP